METKASPQVANPIFDATAPTGPNVGERYSVTRVLSDRSWSSIPVSSDRDRYGRASANVMPGRCVVKRNGQPRCLFLWSYFKISGVGRLLLERSATTTASFSSWLRSCRRRDVAGDGVVLRTNLDPLER